VVVVNRRRVEQGLGPRGEARGGGARQNVYFLTGTFGGGGDQFELLQCEEGEERRLEDVAWWCRDGGGDVEGESPPKKEPSMVLQSQADLLWEGDPCRVIRRGRQGDEDGVLFEGEDDPPYVPESCPDGVGLAENGAKASRQGSFADLAEGEALDKFLDEVGVVV
jgi:hypothetical protein